MTTFFDTLLPIGRTNRASIDAPGDASATLAVMKRHNVKEALVCHTLALDNNPETGNLALDRMIHDQRLHKVFSFDTAAVNPRDAEEFLADALARGARAILVNPAAQEIRISRSIRLGELAALLETRKIPLILAFRGWQHAANIIDWYDLADFCNRFPKLPVIALQWRSRANRPLFDALHMTGNLLLPISTMWQAQMIECVCENFGARRLVFSLGLPELLASSFPLVLHYANLQAEQQQAIAGNNLRSLLAEADYGC